MTKTVTQAVEELVRATVHLPDKEMDRHWEWGEYVDEGLRFALLLTHHELRDLAVRLVAARDHPPSQASRVLAQYHQAYRDLSGALAGIGDADLDRAPADGEWTLRETLAHMIGAEYGFLAVCRFGLERRRSGNADEPRDEEWNAFRATYAGDRAAAERAVAQGTIGEIRDVFATIHIRILRELGDIADDEIEAPAWFWDGAMPLRFRLHRFEEHFRQHIIQVDTTRAVVAPPTEAQRLVRNVYNALADVESETAGLDDLRARSATTIVERAAEITARVQ